MKRLLPSSLLGQVLLAIALTLFVVQGINGWLGYRIEQERRATALVNTIAFRLVAAGRIADLPEGRLRVEIDPAQIAERRDRRARRGRGGGFARGALYSRSGAFPALPDDQPRAELAQRLSETLERNGIAAGQIRVVERDIAADSDAREALRRRAMRRGLEDGEQPVRLVLAGIRNGGEWQLVRAPVPPHDLRYGPFFPLLRALLLTLVLFGVLWLVLRRITGPLAELTRQTERFAAQPHLAEPLEPQGPDDVRRLIVAHNTLEARIAGLLDEKDVMLGAIGHDLKTPLTALRVRVESVADDAQRDKMAAGVAELDRMLDDILSLARVGRPQDPAERLDLAALAAGVVEEYEDRGEPVELAGAEKLVGTFRASWLRRALRNLIDNALRYGGNARLRVERGDGQALLIVSDDGPGIPADRLADMLEPFRRGEASRNRGTGGSGLGLTLVRAIAEQHGGRLELRNREQDGEVAGLDAVLLLTL